MGNRHFNAQQSIPGFPKLGEAPPAGGDEVVAGFCTALTQRQSVSTTSSATAAAPSPSLGKAGKEAKTFLHSLNTAAERHHNLIRHCGGTFPKLGEGWERKL